MRILVIKHGALGDIVLAFGAFSGIRTAHAGAEITLLTSPPFAALLSAAPWFDDVVEDARPDFWDLPGLWRLRQKLRGFDMVYDLQTSARSARYFALAGRPRWSGIAPGCALPHADPARNQMHTRERLAGQLTAAGIAADPRPDLGWLRGDLKGLALPARYALLVPGAAAHRPEKRWPVAHFAALAAAMDIPSVVVGTAAEAPLAAAITAVSAAAVDLTGRTDPRQLAAVAAGATLAVGNDTGPMHLAAALNVPSLVLFGGGSDPALTAPRYPDGGWPRILRSAELRRLPVAQVLAALP